MEAQEDIVTPLLDKLKIFSKNSIELWKLKSMEKILFVFSTLISRVIMGLAIIIALFSTTIALALWLGEILGKLYWGFLMITVLYLLLALILYLFHKNIRNKVNNTLISLMLN